MPLKARVRLTLLYSSHFLNSHSGRTRASCRKRYRMALLVRRKSQAGANIVFSQLREVRKNFLMRHSQCQPAQNVSDRYPHSSNAGLATAFARFNGDNLSIVHAFLLSLLPRPGKSCSFQPLFEFFALVSLAVAKIFPGIREIREIRG